MQDDISSYVNMAKDAMDRSVDHLRKELSKISTGKASPAMLSGIMVPYYGSPTPLSQVANVSISDPKTIVIQPWEKSMLAPIEKAIFEANIGLTPMNDGELVRINIPALTEERRKEFVKRAKALGEEAKVSVRNARRDAMEQIKKEVKDGYPEDAGKRLEEKVQQATDKHVETVDKLVAGKEKDIMTI
ncbi:MAG: ribosome recycling factor [Saprospiraceae bacterium]|nr:ribosome recycling factor [Saprospiraceae bacterium]